MRSSRLMLLAVILAFTFLMPAEGAGKRGGSVSFTPGDGFDKLKVNCSWTCLNGNTGSATTETVDQCYAACAGACGSACGPA